MRSLESSRRRLTSATVHVLHACCRYTYKGQINAVQWNLAQLATSFLVCDLVGESDAQAAVDSYSDQFGALYHGGMAAKIGLKEYDEDVVRVYVYCSVRKRSAKVHSRHVSLRQVRVFANADSIAI